VRRVSVCTYFKVSAVTRQAETRRTRSDINTGSKTIAASIGASSTASPWFEAAITACKANGTRGPTRLGDTGGAGIMVRRDPNRLEDAREVIGMRLEDVRGVIGTGLEDARGVLGMLLVDVMGVIGMLLEDVRGVIGTGPTFLGDTKGVEGTSESAVGRRPKRLSNGKGVEGPAEAADGLRPKRLGDAKGVKGGISEAADGLRPKRLGDAGVEGIAESTICRRPKRLGDAKGVEGMQVSAVLV
jgi:hypothetical protein